jgi:hypothetical protein
VPAVELALNPQPADVLDRRLSRRVRVTSDAVLETLTGNFPGKLWDLSEGGARLQMANSPPPGTTARMRWAEQEVLCSVVWNDGEMCGVSFDSPLAFSIVMATAEVHRVLELPIAQVSKIAAGRKRSARLLPAEPAALTGLVVEFPQAGRNGAMAAAQEMFFHGAPLAHVVAFEARALSRAQSVQKPLG